MLGQPQQLPKKLRGSPSGMSEPSSLSIHTYTVSTVHHKLSAVKMLTECCCTQMVLYKGTAMYWHQGRCANMTQQRI